MTLLFEVLRKLEYFGTLLYITSSFGNIPIFLIFLSKGVIVIKPSESFTQVLDTLYDCSMVWVFIAL